MQLRPLNCFETRHRTLYLPDLDNQFDIKFGSVKEIAGMNVVIINAARIAA